MARRITASLFALFVLLGAVSAAPAQQSYRGFDRNVYPGDAALAALRKSFSYTGYWLNDPPGEVRNSWAGKRAILKRYGFGFLVLYNGRSDKELKAAQAKGTSAAALGAQDAKAAVKAAAREGFERGVLIFLDQEEGGRLLPAQAAYLFAWMDAVRAGGDRPGVYCSGIAVPEGKGRAISTAEEIAEHLSAFHSSPNRGPEGALWIANDACPPSPGCTLANPALSRAFPPALRRFAVAWQYAQSPRRRQFSASCPANAAPDGNCYAPGLPQGADSFVDLDTADSPDPSEAR